VQSKLEVWKDEITKKIKLIQLKKYLNFEYNNKKIVVIKLKILKFNII